MGWKVNVVLGVGVLGLGGYLMFKKRPEPSLDPAENITTVKLLPRSIWRAREVKIQRGALEPILLSLDSDRQLFRITDPVQDVASYATLQSMFRIYDMAELLEHWTEQELKDNPKYFESTGLAKPQAVVEVRYAAKTERIEIGGEGRKVGELFIRVRDRVYVGPRTLLSSIQHNPDDLREKVLFTDLAIGAVEKIRLQRRIGGEMVTDAIEKLPNVGFRIVEPKNLRADMAMVEGLAREVAGLRIHQFVSGGAPLDPSAFSEDLILEVKGERGADRLVVMDFGSSGAKGRKHFLARLENRGIMFELAPGGLANLNQWASVLRARHLVTYAEANIHRVEMQPPGGPKTVLVRGASTGFRMDAPATGATAASPVSELLHAISHMEAREFVDEIPPEAGLADGDDFFLLRVGGSRNASGMTEVRIGNTAVSGLVYARRADEPTAVLLPGDVVAKIRRPWLEFVSPQVFKVTGGAFYLEVTSPSGKEFRYVKKDGLWQEEASGTQARAVKLLAEELRSVRAGRVLPASAVGADQKPVRVVFRRGQTRESGGLVMFELFPYQEGGDALTILSSPKRAQIVYLMERPIFRQLYDTWTR